MDRSVLTAEQMAEFAARGIVRVPALVSPGQAADIADGVWAVLAYKGIHRDEPRTWPAGRLFKLQALTRAGHYRAFAEGHAAMCDELLGAGHWRAVNAPGPLLTFPEDGVWQVPRHGWHFDLPARGSLDPPIALRLLGLVEPVDSHGGGTIIVAGTHTLTGRLVAAAGGDFGRSVDVRRRLAADHQWFRDLFEDDAQRDRFLEPVDIEGVIVGAAELTGDAGDAYLMHPWLLHAAAPNAGTQVRSMLTHSVLANGYRQ